MSTVIRSYWFAVAAIAYVAVASLQANSRDLGAWTLLVLGPVVLFITWRHSGAAVVVGDREPEVRRDCVRAAVTGTLLFLGARTGPLGHPGFDAAANLGVGVSLVAANIALSRIQGRGGILPVPPTTRSLDAAIFSALLWGIATALPTLRSLLASSILLLDPIAVDYATVTASMASLLLMLAVTTRLRFLRSLELDVADRAVSAFIVACVALLVTLPALFLGVVAPDRAVPAIVIVSALFYVWASGTPDARRVTSTLRAWLAIATFLAPAVLFLALLSRNSPERAPLFVIVGSVLSVLLGLFASRLSRPLAPEQTRWLEAIERASEAALVPDPDDALRATLVALGPLAPGPSSQVELWRLQPECILHVDIAGHLHDEAARIPECAIDLASLEPERTLRVEVLRAAVVRNPKAREVLSYFDTRHIGAITLLTSDTGPLGLLALPAGTRRTRLSLEEIGALRRLADRLESVLAITAAQARSRQRELEALSQVQSLTDETRRLLRVLEQDGERQRRFAERYARRLRPTLYSPNARAAQTQLERLAVTERNVSIALPPGGDALGWASLLHLSSPRQAGPFVVFDALMSDFDAEHWDDPDQDPLGIAETGTWVLVDPQALDTERCRTLTRAVIRHQTQRVIDGAPSMGIVLAWHQISGSDLEDRPELAELLRLFPDPNRVTVPALAERSEDLRALVYDRAARLGAVLKGKPIGVETSALAVLLEHDWPLNDLELDVTLYALVLASECDVITTDTLDRIAFGKQQLVTPAPAPSTRKRPRLMAPSIRPKAR